MVSTHLKNISQIGSFPQVGLKIKHVWNHHLDNGDFLLAIVYPLSAEVHFSKLDEGQIQDVQVPPTIQVFRLLHSGKLT